MVSQYNLFYKVSYQEYAANMELGHVFIDIMTSVCRFGYDFVLKELLEETAKRLEYSQTPLHIRVIIYTHTFIYLQNKKSIHFIL